MKICSLYLVTGEVLIARVSDPDENGFVSVDEPRVLVVGEQQGRIGVAFLPYGSCMGVLPAIVKTQIHVSHLLHEPSEIPKRVEDGYLAKLSGIQLAT